jgi:hypothetical protein
MMVHASNLAKEVFEDQKIVSGSEKGWVNDLLVHEIKELLHGHGWRGEGEVTENRMEELPLLVILEMGHFWF